MITVGEFIYRVGFTKLEMERVANVANYIPIILRHPFLATTNALINCKNGMMRLSFDNLTLELNIFNLQRQLSGFDDIETSTLNAVEDSVLMMSLMRYLLLSISHFVLMMNLNMMYFNLMTGALFLNV